MAFVEQSQMVYKQTEKLLRMIQDGLHLDDYLRVINHLIKQYNTL